MQIQGSQDWLLNRSEQQIWRTVLVVTRYYKRSFAVIGGIHLVAIVIWA